MLLIALGIATTLSSLSAFVAPIIFFLIVDTIIIPFEENRLRRTLALSMKVTRDQLGDGYRLWKRQSCLYAIALLASVTPDFLPL
jgi:hypothetical protein